jgi:chemotaxis protein MotB
MSENNDNGPIIIRKKKTDGDEDHHGGVWKLAFADFMTAMMAFFLVMWLINSTSKETKAVIVQYFNPVQLTDTKPAHKGVSDPSMAGQGKNVKKTEGADSEIKEIAGAFEEELRVNPMKALDELAKKDVPVEGAPESKKSGIDEPFQDPFDRVKQSVKAPEGDNVKEKEYEKPDEKKHDPPAVKTSAEALKNRINEILEKEFHDRPNTPVAEVRKNGEEILIGLTDDANFSMFEVGSITPKPQLVRVISQIGKTLSKEAGQVELRGYTDGRVYAGKNYDNWRLSSDRATMVNYMLVRGGLAPARVERVVGFADRHPKNAADPLAPVNRRIEILLRPGLR